jgi:spermidine/putrescine transport system substrate-binding protein
MRKPLSPPARSIVTAQLSRRALLRGVGAFGGATALTACGMGEPDTSDPTAATDMSATDKVVRWANWELYLDFDDEQKIHPTLKAFEQKTGIRAEYAEDIEDNDSYYGKIRAQLKQGEDIGKDLVVFTDSFAARMIREGNAQQTDERNIPNRRNIRPELANVDFDPGRKHSLTWQSGFTGLAWNTEYVPRGLRRVQDLWDESLHGRVEVLTEMRDTIGLIMLDAGVDISAKDWGDNEFLSALDVLQMRLATGQIRQPRGQSYTDDLSSGTAWAVIGWSGDVAQLKLENPDQWGFAIPETGGTLWSDNMLIPIGSPHKTNAERLMDYYYDPAVAAEVAAYVNYISPVEGAKKEMERIDPALVDNPLIFPTPGDLKNVKQFRTLTPEEEVRYATEYQKVLGN